MAFTFLIVDDERLSRGYIRNLLREFEPSGNILEATSAKEALPLLETENVDVLFLDIRMPGTDGFGFLDQLSHRDFELVFVTAYNQYAIKAIKEGASDYLLKPLRRSEFQETLGKVLEKRMITLQHRSGFDSKVRDNYLNKKLSINSFQGIRLITLKNIIYLKADNTYTTVFLEDGDNFVVSKAMHRFEKLLELPWFFRIHKSYLINMSQLKEYISKDGPLAVMKDDTQLFISRYRLAEFLEALKTISGERKI